MQTTTARGLEATGSRSDRIEYDNTTTSDSCSSTLSAGQYGLVRWRT